MTLITFFGFFRKKIELKLRSIPVNSQSVTVASSLRGDDRRFSDPKAFHNHNHNENHMGYKTCAICGRRVYRGEGMYYGGRLIHRVCHGIAKIQRYKLNV